jgi:2-amino-4-hydroxy-6-hydroxymethyldihydropteridine diphosphokinase
VNLPIHRACLLLGSNIEPERHLSLAVKRLQALLIVERVSHAWETPAVGSEGPNFLNAALLVRTDLAPQELKEQVLRPLENELGRVRSLDKNAPRTIDIDVILWDDHVLDETIWHLAHVAVPAEEIWPQPLPGPSGETLVQVAARLERTSPIIRKDLQ